MSAAREAENRSGTSSPALAELVDELAARIQAGEPVDLEATAREYPEHAVELRRLWPTLGDLHDLSRSGEDRLSGLARSPGAEDGLVAGTLGDFRIVAEVGRGAMGVVYEAEQISLRRRVALKVLPFAGALDPRQLQRFKNEAQAAACLQHQHIVPVYFVGCERGVHYYAMQFVDGRPLTEVIRELRRSSEQGGTTPPTADEPPPASGGLPEQEATVPYAGPGPLGGSSAAGMTTQAGLTSESTVGSTAYYRGVARLVEQAAQALQHAHDMGVVHRDIKPGNLLLDGRGDLWVTDFGLARVQTEASLTLTGDLVGTVRYMSPEQALAKRVVIDHHTDIYSLGATLYELLTLRPAFTGVDRQELLRQIAFEEPRPPRRVNRAIPADLETIVLKAMEKNPAERYPTAQEFADDLHHFLEDRPIRARRPTALQRARKWARRHQSVVWAAAVVLLVTAVMGGTGLWLLDRQRIEREVEESHRQRDVRRGVEVALAEAARLRDQARWDLARVALAQAESRMGAQGPEDLRRPITEARDDLDLAARLDDIRLATATRGQNERAFEEEGETPLGSRFDTRPADRDYEAAFAGAGLGKVGDDPSEVAGRIRRSAVRKALVGALDDWAFCAQTPERRSWVLDVCRRADPAPWNDPWRDRARDPALWRDRTALERLTSEKAALDQSPHLLAVLALRLQNAGGNAIGLLRRALDRYPDDFWLNYWLGDQLEDPTTIEEALGYTRVARVLRPDTPAVHTSLGWKFAHMGGHKEEAVAEFRKAIALDPRDASAHRWLGDALRALGRNEEAAAAYQKALDLEPRFAQAHVGLGKSLWDLGRQEQALAEVRKAIDLNPRDAVTRSELCGMLVRLGRSDEASAAVREALRFKPRSALACNNLGWLLATAAEPKCRNGKEAVALAERAVQLDPKTGMYWNTLGAARYCARDWRGAVEALHRSMDLNRGGDGFDWFYLAMAHWQLGDKEQARRWYDKAVPWMEKNKPQDDELRRFRAEAAALLGVKDR